MRDLQSIKRQHIMQKYKECRKEYDVLSEIIERLRPEYVIETDITSKIKLEKRLKAFEDKRERIEQEMEALEDQMQTPDDQDLLKKALLKLDFEHQERTFRQLMSLSQIGAFVIHGEREHGQRWLLWRLIHRIPYYQTARKIECKLPRGCKRNIDTFRDHLISATRFTELHSFREIAGQLHQLWQTQPVILIIHDLNVLDKQSICKFWQEFWRPLVEKALD
ncbi:MAG TPA: hypothetical protein VFA10_13960, partial [Ktedonobacteraceae bacterium]|nr:hypothetical protein [Ktedonobacteraceae bacterium]